LYGAQTQDNSKLSLLESDGTNIDFLVFSSTISIGTTRKPLTIFPNTPNPQEVLSIDAVGAQQDSTSQ
jgi:hypothetical protein